MHDVACSSLTDRVRTPEHVALDARDRVALDTETTGLWWGSRVVELAAVRFRGDTVIGRFSAMVDPERPIPEAVVKIHGITDARVAGLPKLSEVLPAFRRFIDGAVVLAHNAEFDRDIVGAEFVRAGQAPPDEPLFCTLKLARVLLAEAPRFGLQRLAEHFALRAESPHQALADADLTRRLYGLLQGRMGPCEAEALLAHGCVEGRPYRFSEGPAGLASDHAFRLLWPQLHEGLRCVIEHVVHDQVVGLRGRVESLYLRRDEAYLDLRTGPSRVESVALASLVAVKADG